MSEAGEGSTEGTNTENKATPAVQFLDEDVELDNSERQKGGLPKTKPRFSSVKVEGKGSKIVHQMAQINGHRTIKRGSCVLLQGVDALPLVAIVNEIFEQRGKKLINVTWMYRKSDLRIKYRTKQATAAERLAGTLQTQANMQSRQLYMTGHKQNVDANSIIQPCVIYFLGEEPGEPCIRQSINGCDVVRPRPGFVCRTYYDVELQELHSLAEEETFSEQEALDIQEVMENTREFMRSHQPPIFMARPQPVAPPAAPKSGMKLFMEAVQTICDTMGSVSHEKPDDASLARLDEALKALKDMIAPVRNAEAVLKAGGPDLGDKKAQWERIQEALRSISRLPCEKRKQLADAARKHPGGIPHQRLQEAGVLRVLGVCLWQTKLQARDAADYPARVLFLETIQVILTALKEVKPRLEDLTWFSQMQLGMRLVKQLGSEAWVQQECHASHKQQARGIQSSAGAVMQAWKAVLSGAAAPPPRVTPAGASAPQSRAQPGGAPAEGAGTPDRPEPAAGGPGAPSGTHPAKASAEAPQGPSAGAQPAEKPAGGSADAPARQEPAKGSATPASRPQPCGGAPTRSQPSAASGGGAGTASQPVSAKPPGPSSGEEASGPGPATIHVAPNWRKSSPVKKKRAAGASAPGPASEPAGAKRPRVSGAGATPKEPGQEPAIEPPSAPARAQGAGAATPDERPDSSTSAAAAAAQPSAAGRGLGGGSGGRGAWPEAAGGGSQEGAEAAGGADRGPPSAKRASGPAGSSGAQRAAGAAEESLGGSAPIDLTSLTSSDDEDEEVPLSQLASAGGSVSAQTAVNPSQQIHLKGVNFNPKRQHYEVRYKAHGSSHMEYKMACKEYDEAVACIKAEVAKDAARATGASSGPMFEGFRAHLWANVQKATPHSSSSGAAPMEVPGKPPKKEKQLEAAEGTTVGVQIRVKGLVLASARYDIDAEVILCVDGERLAPELWVAKWRGGAPASREEALDAIFVPNTNATLMTYLSEQCIVCRAATDEEKMLVCERCEDMYHIYCLDPPLASIPDGEWYCPRCQEQAGDPAAAL